MTTWPVEQAHAGRPALLTLLFAWVTAHVKLQAAGRVLLSIGGLASICVGAFLLATWVGFVVLGVALLALDWLVSA